MIRWRLRILMAEKKISNKELALLSGIHPTSISKLKNADEIEQISGRVLNNLCNALTKAYHAKGDERIITPGDLFDYTYDGDGDPGYADIQSVAIEKPKNRHSHNPGKSDNANAQVFWLLPDKEAS
ncbi:helix-turn-helix domain-containing protein [aff. Roholtiella sp. LEGE 12411]|uniref:helix-turn-helix domain-containing protein n=1 Tax=aff. Roholtiella sp. LEGE 12411 TaxID=1828822 RepID=UPI00187DFC4E|nr:helix-turn-helix transcriptional regulator [aff. Roholtiella sp. LEGE 12411]MBE9037203.1 helix-turn-helix transcriptional regulator [aff. Roholtiella sp. LEGE 12411]